jgi:glutamate-1-semialdehyde aminotransferase
VKTAPAPTSRNSTKKETLATPPFAERGGTAVVSDADGNVYIAGSQVYIYNRAGKQLGIL